MQNGWDLMAARIVQTYNLTGVIKQYRGEVDTIRKLDAIPEIRQVRKVPFCGLCVFSSVAERRLFGDTDLANR